MGRITNVFYDVVSEDKCTLEEAGSYYFFYNMMGISDDITSKYEAYEEKQIDLRNRILGNAFNRGEIPRHPKVDTTIFGISSLKNMPIIVTEY